MVFNRLIPPTELPNEKYHAIDELDGLQTLSSSGLRQAKIDAKIYHNRQRLLRLPSSTLELGSALHEAVLTPNSFDIKNYDLTPANKKKFEIMKNNFLVMFDYIVDDKNTLKEHSIFVKNNGFIRKVRPDIFDYKNGIIYDIKTTKETTPRAFEKSAYEYGYHLQASYYIDTLLLAGFKVKAFAFLVIPSDSPCEPFATQATGDFIEDGRSEYIEAVKKLLDFNKSKNQVFFHKTDLPLWRKQQLGLNE